MKIQPNLSYLKKRFFDQFAVSNVSSLSRVWWRVPLTGGNKELADPTKVWEWIESQFKSYLPSRDSKGRFIKN